MSEKYHHKANFAEAGFLSSISIEYLILRAKPMEDALRSMIVCMRALEYAAWVGWPDNTRRRGQRRRVSLLKIPFSPNLF